MILGPHFGEWLANRMHLARVWLWAWPYIHLMIAVAVLAVEALYFLAPNVQAALLRHSARGSFGRFLDWPLIF
jgi:hypothetical protein